MATDKIICDTDVIIDYWNSKSPRHSITKNEIDNEIGLSNVIISVITQIELMVGATDKNELSKTNKSIRRFSIISIDDVTASATVELVKSYTLSHGLALPDAFIAASSIMSGYQLFTYNVKDYKFINGLSLYQPSFR